MAIWSVKQRLDLPDKPWQFFCEGREWYVRFFEPADFASDEQSARQLHASRLVDIGQAIDRRDELIEGWEAR